MGEDNTGSRRLLTTSVAALGVVFGDIGTSPLYAFRETFAVGDLAVTDRNVLGVLSLIFWSLIVVVSIKYLLFVMRADNHGEGGILALTALAVRPSRPRLRTAARVLLTLGVVGTAFLYGDGVITPAISVLSAVEGASLAAPALEPLVVPFSVVVIVALFAVQKRGTGQVGAVFGPVMIVWFVALAVMGAAQIFSAPSVLSAVDPRHAVQFFAGRPAAAFVSLGAVVLVVTGCEALYADMGHFGKRPIRLTWFVLALPALVLNYLGQGALLMARPETIDNPFYALAPSWALVPMVVLATVAAVIASQALISGAYSLTRQASHLGFLPRIKIDHTSAHQLGQVYIGSVNYALMTACVVTILAFGSSGALAAAYGIAVTATMLITTLLLYSVMRVRWRWSRWLAGAVTLVFLVIDGAFFSANLLKIADGGWLPLAIGAAVTSAMLSWFVGRRRLIAKMGRGNLPIERFIGSIAAHPQIRVKGTGVYMFPEPGVTPPALLANLRNNGVLHETILLVSVQTGTTPRVHRAARATIHPLGEGFYQVVLKFGFMERVDVPGALTGIGTADFGFDPTDAVYIVGKETVVVPGSWRRFPMRLFAAMHRNAVDAARYFKLPPRDVLEVGIQVEL
ncbi:MAG TPA: potassium transporter Kup [Acidimicrobiia bacterium]